MAQQRKKKADREVAQTADAVAQPVEPPAQPPAGEADQVPNPATELLGRPPLADVGVTAAKAATKNPARMYPDPDKH